MAAGSFSQEQIRHFRQVYSQYSAAGLLTFEGYQAAVVAALQQASLSSVPPPEFLSGEFERLSGDSGGISWQQFFQVCRQQGREVWERAGKGGREEWAIPAYTPY